MWTSLILIAALCCTEGPFASALPWLIDTQPSLQQFALGKLLQDGREIFGDAAGLTSSSRTKSPGDWMRAVPDHTPLESLNIPGVHDIATWNYSIATQQRLLPATECTGVTIQDPIVYRCQRRSIAAALAAGVRFFDLRYALDPTGTSLVFWHNEALLSERASLGHVLFAFWDWLDVHASEALFLSLQYQGSTQDGAANDAAVQRMLLSVLTSDASRRYFHQTTGALPTMGEARGKAVMIRRFDMDQLGDDGDYYDAVLPGLHLSPTRWTDNDAAIELVYNDQTGATAYIEDRHQPTELPASADAAENIAAKLNATAAHLRMAAADEVGGGHPDSLYITFASGGNLDAADPVYPQYMALGNGSAATPEGGVNAQLVPVLRGLRGRRKGVVVLDFFEGPENLVDLILDI